MAIDLIHVNKFLRLAYSSDKQLRSALLVDINQEKRKAAGSDSGGGDFYSPFWADARKHILGEADLSVLTTERIKKNGGRKNLYPKLEQGVLALWERGHNLDVELLSVSPKGRFPFPDIGLTAKVESIMALSIEGEERLVYPYWFPDPILSEEAARIGLWLLSQVLSNEQSDNFRIFDIIRAEYFSLATCPLQGNEKSIVAKNYKRILALRQSLIEEKR